MRRILQFVTMVFGLSACVAGLDVKHNSRKEVTVEGVPHVVYEMKANKSYKAFEQDLTGGFRDPNDYRQNVMAIEKVSGCRVVPETVTNQGLQTTALVECK